MCLTTLNILVVSNSPTEQASLVFAELVQFYQQLWRKERGKGGQRKLNKGNIEHHTHTHTTHTHTHTFSFFSIFGFFFLFQITRVHTHTHKHTHTSAHRNQTNLSLMISPLAKAHDKEIDTHTQKKKHRNNKRWVAHGDHKCLEASASFLFLFCFFFFSTKKK